MTTSRMERCGFCGTMQRFPGHYDSACAAEHAGYMEGDNMNKRTEPIEAGYRGAPVTEIRGGIVYHTFTGKASTFWVNCQDCGKRQPAGTEILTAYGGESITRVERLSKAWAKPEIGRCSVCASRGPLVEIKLYQDKGPYRPSRCGLGCLEAKGDDCNCVCRGRDHGAGVCSCQKELAWGVESVEVLP